MSLIIIAAVIWGICKLISAASAASKERARQAEIERVRRAQERQRAEQARMREEWKVCDNCRMKSCDISHEIIESVSGNSSCSIKINTAETLHYICVIRDLKIGNHGLTELLYLNIL